MGCLNTTLRVRGQAKSTLPQRPPWMLRDSASSPFPTQPPLNPALGLTRLRGCLLRSSASCPSSFQWPGPWRWLRSQGPPWDFSLAGIPGWPVFWSCKPAPLQLWGTRSLSTFGNSGALSRSLLRGISKSREPIPGTGRVHGTSEQLSKPADWGPGRKGAEPGV